MSERDEPLLLTVREVAQMCQIGRTAAYELVKRGEIRSITVGARTRRVPRAQVEAWIERELETQGEGA